LATFSSDRDARFANLIELLRARTAEHASRVAFRYLADGETEESHLTYEELEWHARAVAAALAPRVSGGLGLPKSPQFVIPSGARNLSFFSWP